MLPSKDDVTAARQIWVNRQLKEAEDKKRREAEAAARQEKVDQDLATSLLSKLKHEILTAMAQGKNICYLRVGVPRDSSQFGWGERERRVAEIMIERIKAVTDDYLPTYGTEKHHYFDSGYGCSRDCYEFFPAVEIRWK